MNAAAAIARVRNANENCSGNGCYRGAVPQIHFRGRVQRRRPAD